MPSTAAYCWPGGRPLAFGAGTCSPGGSLQTRWSQWTSGDEGLAHLVQRTQEGGFLAVAAIHPNPAEPHPPRPRRPHHLERKQALGAHRARRHRDLGPVAAGRVIDPTLRQVEPHGDRRVPRPVGQHREHRPLIIVDFAQAPAPRPGHANRVIAVLDEAAFVEEQRAVRLAAQQAVGVTADLRDDRLVPPRRVADEGLELRFAAILNHSSHRNERGRLRLRKPVQVALGHRRVVVPAAAEEPAVAVDEARKRSRDAIDQRCAQRSSAHTLTRRIDALTSPLPVPDVLGSQ
jgi:hypothetical protein